MFHDLIAVAQASQGAVDMLCRILASLDEDVISLEVPRCASCPASLLKQSGLDPRTCRDGARFRTRTRPAEQEVPRMLTKDAPLGLLSRSSSLNDRVCCADIRSARVDRHH